MGWQTTGDAAEFLAAASEYLRAERARNTVLLTVTAAMRANPARYYGGPDAKPDPAHLPLLGWWTGPAGEVGGAFLHTPPFPLLLTTVTPPAGAALALTLAGRPLAGVNACPAVAEAFAGFWRDATGCGARVHRRERLYRLAELSWPDPPPDGVPRVGPVYAPPELRGRGYASAATAAVSQRALDADAAETLLFTDLANPVSNSVYQRIGYRAIEDRTVLVFDAA